MWLTRLALKNPILMLMVSMMVCVLGYVSLTRLSVDLFPNINIPIIVRLQGTNAEEAKKLIDESGLKVQSAILLSEAAELVNKAVA